MEPKTIEEWKKLIENQIALSDYGQNTHSLNTLYYDFYLFVTRGV